MSVRNRILDYSKAFDRKDVLASQNKKISEIAEALANYDLIDILTKIGSLYLAPENASHSVRLDSLMYAAALNRYQADKPRITKSNFRRLIRKYFSPTAPFGYFEDPCENMFTEAFTFFNGSYVVFPGIKESSTYILRNICKAMFLVKENPLDAIIITYALPLVSGVLILSDEIARRAKLKRGVEPSQATTDAQIFYPSPDQENISEQAIIFTTYDFENLLERNNVSGNVLDSLIMELGSFPNKKYDPDNLPFIKTPIIKAADKIIIPSPGFLIEALIHHLLCIVYQSPKRPEICKSFMLATWDTVMKSLGLLHSALIDSGIPPMVDEFVDGFFTLDIDKVLYVQFVSDNLSGFDPDQPFSEWTISDLPDKLKNRFTEVVEKCFSTLPKLNDIMFLCVVQSLGRPFRLAFEIPDNLASLRNLFLSSADLETIAYLEQDSMVLWKYAKKKLEIREKFKVVSTGELDEFEFYRSRLYGYFMPDESEGVLLIGPGGGGRLRFELNRKLDKHGVIADPLSATAEVISVFKTGIPIYIPEYLLHELNPNTMVVESMSVPFWIFGENGSDDKNKPLNRLYYIFVDVLSYWLWQVSPSLKKAIIPLEGRIQRLVIRIFLEPDTDWFNPNLGADSDDSNCISFTIKPDNYEVILRIKSIIMPRLNRPDNYGERLILSSILHALKELLAELRMGKPELLNNDSIRLMVDKHAPLGLKKKSLMLYGIDPTLDPRFLPPIRKVQDSDNQDVLDFIGNYLKSERLPKGRIPQKDRNRILNGTVSFLYKHMQRTISTLNSSQLLSFLIIQNESISWEISLRHLTIPMRLNCFSEEPILMKELTKEVPEMDQTSIALRFLIEYVAACPPIGVRPISNEIYDYLLSLAAEIVALGNISDLVNYKITKDIYLEVSKYGRLGISKDKYDQASTQFLHEHSITSIRVSTERFPENWDTPQPVKPEESEGLIQRFNEAYKSEFGVTVTEHIMITNDIGEIGDKQNYAEKIMRMEKLVKAVSSHTGLPDDTVMNFINNFALIPRKAYLKPGGNFDDSDVYPWRHNRALSYIRRPLIRFQLNNNDMIAWGNRHLVHSVRYLQHLCMSGRLKARSLLMQQMLGRIRNNEGKAFNHKVFLQFSTIPDVIVREHIEKFCGLQMTDERGVLGDIDVIASNIVSGKMLVIECKNLNMALTPHDLNSELLELFAGRDSISAVLNRKYKWVKNNLNLVSQELGLPSDKQWIVDSTIVISEELIAPFIKDKTSKIITFRQLQERFIKRWIKSDCISI